MLGEDWVLKQPAVSSDCQNPNSGQGLYHVPEEGVMRAAEPLGSAGRPWLSSCGTELPREVREWNLSCKGGQEVLSIATAQLNGSKVQTSPEQGASS